MQEVWPETFFSLPIFSLKLKQRSRFFQICYKSSGQHTHSTKTTSKQQQKSKKHPFSSLMPQMHTLISLQSEM
jgi:hypothetical protein